MDYIEYLDLSKNPREFIIEFKELISNIATVYPNIPQRINIDFERPEIIFDVRDLDEETIEYVDDIIIEFLNKKNIEFIHTGAS